MQGIAMTPHRTRCVWAASSENPLLQTYHDLEWGVPVHDDIQLFEFLILEGAQAGLSWNTILKKRENYRKAFAGFDPEIISVWGPAQQTRLLGDAGIVRNRLKIKAAQANAAAVVQIRKEFGSLDAFLWPFVGNAPVQNRWKRHADMPAHTPVSDRLSAELKRRGMNFVGSTICYSFMQAVGMVNDHMLDCFRHEQIAKLANRPTKP